MSKSVTRSFPFAAITMAAGLLLSALPASAQTAIKLFAADTMAPAVADLVAEFQKATGGKFKLDPVVGSSASLRERIEKGEGAHLFASADPSDAKKLADAGRTRGPAVKFAIAGGKEHTFVVLKDAPPAAGELAGFLRYGPGQAVLKKHGFAAP